MLLLRSIQLLNSRFESDQLSTGFHRHKPISTIFLCHPTMKTENAASGVITSVHELAKGVVHLQCESSAEGGVCDVYLVGTCHISEESCREVKAVINYLKPQVVFLELCERRQRVLTDRTYEVITASDVFYALMDKGVNPVGLFHYWLETKAAKELKVLPGAEFRVAYEEALSNGAQYVYLGDRPFDITMRRTWERITIWQMIKCLYHCLETYFLLGKIAKEEGCTRKDILQAVIDDMDENVDEHTAAVQHNMSKAFPALETLIFERDQYMSHKLWQEAREHSSVVAVVGKLHLAGIKRSWMQPVDVQSLLQVPPEKKYFGTLKKLAAVGALAGVFVASGMYLWSRK